MVRISRIDQVKPVSPKKNETQGGLKKNRNESDKDKKKPDKKPNTGHQPGRLDETV